MPAFKMPDFYMPWPARLNPHLETTRAHSKAWAYEMGILLPPKAENSPSIWSESKFDAMDIALECAYTHPDASSDELNLITDWFVWLFFFDDYFLEIYILAKDLVGAKEYIARLLPFMPIDSLDAMTIATNPVEGGLADLWKRTTPTTSIEWRTRFAESTKFTLKEPLAEVLNLRRNRMTNPIEFIQMRRNAGGALWSADLVEHAVGVEIPAALAAMRPLRVIKEAFADVVHLHNDITSYEKELAAGENSNCVMVTEQFLQCSPQEAVNVVHDLMTARIHQFEHTVATELPALFEEKGIDWDTRIAVFKYIKGLQDWRAGDHEWHLTSGRYVKDPGTSYSIGPFVIRPTGLGTAALQPQTIYTKLGLARFKNYRHIPYQPVGVTSMPSFYMPYTARVNPNLARARRNSKQWACQMGLLEAVPGVPGGHVWDEHKFDATDMAFCASMFHPDASAEILDLIADWLVWSVYADDYYAARYGDNRDVTGAKYCTARLLLFMPIDVTNDVTNPLLPPANPFERAIADVWSRTAGLLATNARQIMRRSIEEMLDSWAWELVNLAQNRLPELIDYVEMRRKTFGADFTAGLARLDSQVEIPPEFYDTATLREINNSAADYVDFTNDLFSYQKEVEYEGDMHNMVLILQNFWVVIAIKA